MENNNEKLNELFTLANNGNSINNDNLYDYLKEFKNDVNWYYISKYQKLSENFIREFQNEVNWPNISQYQKLSEDFIKEFKSKVNWSYISMYQKLSEEFIKEFTDKVDWSYISQYQKLSEDFIREFKSKVDWDCISMCQKLSEDFIKEFKIEVNWFCISQYQKLSESFIKEFKNELELNDENWLNEKSWMYKDSDYKLEQVKLSGLYEIEGDYVIGFKGIRSDRYSKFNFQYQYLPNQTYECHANFNTNDENSFGLSVWTYDEAFEYCNQLVIKVKIHKNDLSALIHENHKIRCQKFTTIN